MIVGLLILGFALLVILVYISVDWCQVGIHTYDTFVDSETFYYDKSLRKMSARLGLYYSKSVTTKRKCRCGKVSTTKESL